jgi:hypothetical protein
MLFALLVAAVAVVWLVGYSITDSMTKNDLHADWPLGLGGADSVPRRFPPIGATEGVEALTTAAARLGIDLRERSHGMDTPTLRSAADYVTAEVTRTTNDVQQPPSPLGAFLATHSPELDEVETIATTAPLGWPEDVQKGHEAPLPNLIGIVRLQRLLLARALARHADSAAWNELHASWNLGRALLGRPEMISNLVGLAVVRNTNAVARTLPPPAPTWRNEMLAFDYRRAFVASQQAEAWMVATAGRRLSSVNEDIRPDGNRPIHRIASIVLRPYVSYSAAGLEKAYRDSSSAFASMNQCGIDVDAFNRISRIPTWNFMARASYPSLGGAWQRVLRLRADLEATSKLLELESARASAGAWPDSIPGLSTSACSDGHWLYERRNDGSMTLRFSKELSSPLHGTTPLQFTWR